MTCSARGLCNDDSDLHNTMKETSEVQTIRALRRPRCSILTACRPANPLKRWNKYADRYDPPIFRDGKDWQRLSFDDWQLQIQSRIETNADNIPLKPCTWHMCKRSFNLAYDQSLSCSRCSKNSRIGYGFELSKTNRSQRLRSGGFHPRILVSY